MTPLRKQLFGTTMIVRDPVTIGVALGASATTGVVIGGTLVASYAAIVGYIATTLVTSWAMSALAPKPDFSTSGTSWLLVNGRDPDLGLPLVASDKAVNIKRDHLIVDVDVTDLLNLVPGQDKHLVQELVVCPGGLVIGDRPAFTRLTVNKVVRCRRIAAIDEQPACAIRRKVRLRCERRHRP